MAIKNIMLFLDTDKHATPFDILMAYDCGFDVVLPYEQVEVEDAVKIVQDAMFSRGTKGVESTTIFIAGTDVEKSRKILEKVKKVMFPPFEFSVVFDPRGGHTTASALVAKVEEALSKHRLGNLQGKKVVILAGTGQVGRLAARICSSRGAEVSITSRQKARADKIAREIEAETGFEVRGLQAATLEETYESVKDADIIISTGKAGVETLPMSVLRKLERCEILADVNAISPLGIEGVALKADNEEVLPGIYGIGALSIGDLKYKIEAQVLNEARKARGGLFDYKFAFEKGKELLERKISTREVLEIESLDGKKLTVVFLQKLGAPSKPELDRLKKITRRYDPDFASVELGKRSFEGFYKRGPYVKIFQEVGVPTYPVDISEYARSYLEALLGEKKRIADKLSATYEELEKTSDKARAEYMKAYADALQMEYEEMNQHLQISVRNSWMVKGILDCSKKLARKELTCIYVGGISHWKGMQKLLRSVNVEIRETH